MKKDYQIDYNFQILNRYKEIKDIQIVQIGRLYCGENLNVHKHVHGNWFELTCVTSGNGVIITNNVETPVSKGDIYLSLPGDFHEIISDKNNTLKFDFFSFQTTNEDINKDLKKIVFEMKSYEQRLIKSENIFNMISSVIVEMSSDLTYKEEMIYLLLKQVIIQIIRSINNSDVEIKNQSTSKDDLCFQIMHYIDTHIYSIKSLNDLSAKFKYNYSYLSGIFKQTTNGTLFSYYQARRLDTAKLMLNDRKEKINKISEILGYTSPDAFSKAFKSYFGISPQKYLQSIKML